MFHIQIIARTYFNGMTNKEEKVILQRLSILEKQADLQNFYINKFIYVVERLITIVESVSEDDKIRRTSVNVKPNNKGGKQRRGKV